jgi:hypothetical protein
MPSGITTTHTTLTTTTTHPSEAKGDHQAASTLASLLACVRGAGQLSPPHHQLQH